MKIPFTTIATISAVMLVLATTASRPAVAQAPLNWRTAQLLDTGVQSSIAVTPSGLVVETHRSENSNSKVWYHVGKIRKNIENEYYISWGSSQPLDYVGERPTVSITKRAMFCSSIPAIPIQDLRER